MTTRRHCRLATPCWLVALFVGLGACHQAVELPKSAASASSKDGAPGTKSAAEQHLKQGADEDRQSANDQGVVNGSAVQDSEEGVPPQESRPSQPSPQSCDPRELQTALGVVPGTRGGDPDEYSWVVEMAVIELPDINGDAVADYAVEDVTRADGRDGYSRRGFAVFTTNAVAAHSC